MTEAERKSWLAVARETLKGIPADLLIAGCRHARRYANHPQRIVPLIIEEIGQAWEDRRRSLRDAQRDAAALLVAPDPPPKDLMLHRGEPMTVEETAELNRILESLGAIARYLPDGSRYFLDGRSVAPEDLEPLPVDRKAPPSAPTREDYLSWGVDPATLDKLEAERKE